MSQPHSLAHTYRFYTYSIDTWEAIYEACKRAQSSILFEHFILRDDRSGRPLIELFKRKAKKGVTIKLLLDAVGSAELLQLNLETELTDVGIEVIFFNSLIPLRLSHYTPWYFRDHRKLVVIDSTTAFTGGVCFQEHMRDWRDTGLEISGPVVKEMETSFFRMWKRAQKKPTPKTPPHSIRASSPYAYVTNIPAPRERHLYYTFLQELRNAKRYVYLTSPYFVPDKKFLGTLLRMARNVDARLLIPKHADLLLIDRATRSYLELLLRHRVRIFRYTPVMNHTKSAVIDGTWGTIGSMNLDHLSLQYNFEANIVSTDHHFVSQLEKQFNEDVTESEELTLAAWRERPFHEKVEEILVRPIRFLL